MWCCCWRLLFLHFQATKKERRRRRRQDGPPNYNRTLSAPKVNSCWHEHVFMLCFPRPLNCLQFITFFIFNSYACIHGSAMYRSEVVVVSQALKLFWSRHETCIVKFCSILISFLGCFRRLTPPLFLDVKINSYNMESLFVKVVLFYLLFALFVTTFFGEEYYSTATDRDKEVKASSKTKEKLLF